MDESTVSLFKAAACFSCKNLSSINWKPHFFKYESKIQGSASIKMKKIQ